MIQVLRISNSLYRIKRLIFTMDCTVGTKFVYATRIYALCAVNSRHLTATAQG